MKFSHTCFGDVSEERLSKISRYRFQDMVFSNFSGPATYGDLKDILLYHPNPVVRHEASFIIGELGIEELIPYLVKVVKFDQSIVGTHEAIEALGKFKNSREAERIKRFLTQITTNKNYDERIRDPDIQATARLSLEQLSGS